MRDEDKLRLEMLGRKADEILRDLLINHGVRGSSCVIATLSKKLLDDTNAAMQQAVLDFFVGGLQIAAQDLGLEFRKNYDAVDFVMKKAAELVLEAEAVAS